MNEITKVVARVYYSIHSAIQLRKVAHGKKNTVFGNITILNRKKVTIGNECSINHGVYINALNPIRIGNDVTLSVGSKVISTGVDYESWASGKGKKHISHNGIVIGDHVWVGADAMILNNVQITGQYVVVAANAVVTKDIAESYVIVGGCPARIIKRIMDGKTQ